MSDFISNLRLSDSKVSYQGDESSGEEKMSDKFHFTQWTTPDDTHYLPAGRVVKQLPPGYYDICESMSGIFLKKKPTKDEALIRFPDASSDAVIEEIQKFWNMEKSFREDKIPYKRGIMLYGPPGSGKTCTIRLAVEDLVAKQKGVVIDFPGARLFREGYELIRGIHTTMPIITLMEDIDAVLARYNESEVLNLLDGMYGIDKMIFLATTNYPERLGSRIMNRPSRFDKRIFIGMPSEVARETYLRTKLKSVDEAKKWAKDTDGFSIAHLKELYVAHKILGDSYDQALKTLRKMKNSTKSSDFDDYGTGKVYREFKETGTVKSKVLSESAPAKTLARGPKSAPKNAPQSIAESISEDIGFNNGIVVE